MNRLPLFALWATLSSAGAAHAAMTPQQNAQAFTDAQAKLLSLSHTNVNADVQAMLAYFGAHPDLYTASGSERSCVWATLADGTYYTADVLPVTQRAAPPASPSTANPLPGREAERMAIPSGASPDSSPDASSLQLSAAAAPESELPKSKQVRIINTFGSEAQFSQKIAAVLGEGRFGYQVKATGGDLESLKSITGDGVFLMDAHCNTVVIGGAKMAFVETDTQVNAASLATYAADAKAVRVVEMGGVAEERDAGGALVSRRVYGKFGIGPKWVTHYGWSFSKNSFVWINACKSNNAALRNAFFGAGASVYGGWTASVASGKAANASHYLFDRLLGANELAGTGAVQIEDPKQRPFPLSTLLADLAAKGFDKDPNPAPEPEARLVFTNNSNQATHFGLLAPSVAYCRVKDGGDQNSSVLLKGYFGSQPPQSEYKVTIGGTTANVTEWKPGRLTIVTPDNPHAHGDVIVRIRDHESNKRRITAWSPDFDLTARDPGTISGAIKVHAAFSAEFRADVAKYREKPGATPIVIPDENQAGTFLDLNGDSGVAVQVSGTRVDQASCDDKPAQQSTKATGSTSLLVRNSHSGGDQLTGSVTIQPGMLRTKWIWTFSLIAPGKLLLEEHSPCSDESHVLPLGAGWGAELKFDTDLAIMGKTITEDSGTLKWDNTPAVDKPDSDAAK